MPNWYCIRTTAGREKIARGRLESFHIETLLPFTKLHYVDRFDRKLSKDIALFPGYLFAHCRRDEYSLAVLGWRKEILKLVGFDDDAQILPLYVIEEIRARMIGNMVRLDDGLRVGADVEIVSGSFNGQRGRLFSENSDERVAVLINILGRDSSLEFDRCRVRPVEFMTA